MTIATTYDWAELIATSEYDALLAIREALRDGDLEDAEAGLQELIDTVVRIHRITVGSHLRQLMAHVLKWKIQPGFRSRSWATTIMNARDEIDDILKSVPTVTEDVVRDELWDDAFRRGKKLAEAETGLKMTISNLTWAEVFDDEYLLPVNDETF